MAAASFGTLFSESVDFCKGHVKSLLAGAVVVGVLMGGVHANTQMQAKRMAMAPMAGLGMNIDMERMQDLQRRVQNGDEAAMQEMEKQAAEMAKKFEGMSEDEARALVVKQFGGLMGLGSFVGMSVLITLLITAAASSYYVLFALAKQDDPMAVWKKVPKYILPMLGVWLWSMLRSFIWIPIVGIVLAIIFGPRMALAPLILVNENKGVFDSVKLSIDRTKGYWGKIVGNILLLALIGIVVSMIVGMVLGMLLFVVPFAPAIANGIVGQILTAFYTVFLVRLGFTVMANPIKR